MISFIKVSSGSFLHVSDYGNKICRYCSVRIFEFPKMPKSVHFIDLTQQSNRENFTCFCSNPAARFSINRFSINTRRGRLESSPKLTEFIENGAKLLETPTIGKIGGNSTFPLSTQKLLLKTRKFVTFSTLLFDCHWNVTPWPYSDTFFSWLQSSDFSKVYLR